MRVCDCPGAPCEHVPMRSTYRILPDQKRLPLTMEACDRLEAEGLWRLAEIGRHYAVDRPRRFPRIRAFFARCAPSAVTSKDAA